MKRKHWFKLHSIFGLITGSLLLVIGLTGSLLIFSREIDQLVNPAIMEVEPGQPMSLDKIHLGLKSQLGQHRLLRWERNLGPTYPDKIRFNPISSKIKQVNPKKLETKTAFVNPVTGKVMGIIPFPSNTLFHKFILKFHYTLFLGRTGYFIAGVVGIFLVFLSFTGVYLYRNFWKNLFRLRLRESARILFSDIHKFIGIFTVIFNIILGFTGAWWSMQSNVFSNRNIFFSKKIKKEVEVFPTQLYNQTVSLTKLKSIASTKIPDFHIGRIYFPNKYGDPIKIRGTAEKDHPLRSRLSSSISFAPFGTHKIIDVQDIRKASFSKRLLNAFIPLHFGTFGGIFSRILWVFVGLSPGVLFISGSIIYFSRNKSKKNKKKTTKKESQNTIQHHQTEIKTKNTPDKKIA